MTAHEPRPGAQAPGAPVVAGGQATGAGSLAPGAANSPELELWVDIDVLEEQLRELEEQLEAEIESECRWIARRLNDIFKRDVYGSFTRNALNTYEDFTFRYPLYADTVESIMRVIDVCKKAETARLVDYAPEVRDIIERLKETIEEEAERGEEDEEDDDRTERLEWLAGLVKDLEEMTFVDFLSDGETIIKKLNKYKYYDEAHDLTIAVDVNNILSNALVEELRFVGKKFNAEYEAEELITCIVGC